MNLENDPIILAAVHIATPQRGEHDSTTYFALSISMQPESNQFKSIPFRAQAYERVLYL
jgi:hypothetical protein